jgi:chorismate mutase
MTYEEEVAELRDEINMLDVEIVNRLARRVKVASKIGEVKRKYGKPVEDKNRESSVFARVRKQAQQCSIDSECVEQIFREVIKFCTDIQWEGMS